MWRKWFNWKWHGSVRRSVLNCERKWTMLCSTVSQKAQTTKVHKKHHQHKSTFHFSSCLLRLRVIAKSKATKCLIVTSKRSIIWKMNAYHESVEVIDLRNSFTHAEFKTLHNCSISSRCLSENVCITDSSVCSHNLLYLLNKFEVNNLRHQLETFLIINMFSLRSLIFLLHLAYGIMIYGARIYHRIMLVTLKSSFQNSVH